VCAARLNNAQNMRCKYKALALLAPFSSSGQGYAAAQIVASPSSSKSHDAANMVLAAQRWLQRWQAEHAGTTQYHPAHANAQASSSLIPRIILMTVASVDEALRNYGHLMKEWWTQNPEYSYLLLSDADCKAFLQACCPAAERTAYSVLKTGPSRADLFRAIWMRDIGGVYVDQDSMVTRPLRNVIPHTASIVAHQATKLPGKPAPGWNFNFLAFQPQCPIWQTQVDRVVAGVLEQAKYACHHDARGCRGFYACVQNVTGSRPFRLTVKEVTQRYGCHGMHDCTNATHAQLRAMVLVKDDELPLKHQVCHAKRGMRHPCKRPNETNQHYVSLPAASVSYYLTPPGRRDGSSAPAYYESYCGPT
jgi:hypothetical protein